MKKPAVFAFHILLAIGGLVLSLSLSDAAMRLFLSPLVERGFTIEVFSLTEGFALKLKMAIIVFVMLAHPFALHCIVRRVGPGRLGPRGVAAFMIVLNLAFYAGAGVFFAEILPRALAMLLPKALGAAMISATEVMNAAFAWLIAALCVDAIAVAAVFRMCAPVKAEDVRNIDRGKSS